MWTQICPSAFDLLRVGTLWDQILNVELCNSGRLGTWTIKSQADEVDRHTTNWHTAIWAEFRLARLFGTSTNTTRRRWLQSWLTTTGDQFSVSVFDFSLNRGQNTFQPPIATCILQSALLQHLFGVSSDVGTDIEQHVIQTCPEDSLKPPKPTAQAMDPTEAYCVTILVIHRLNFTKQRFKKIHIS